MDPVGRDFQFAAELAEEDINRRADVLPGYRLVLEPVNTQVRERDRGLELVNTQVRERDRVLEPVNIHVRRREKGAGG